MSRPRKDSLSEPNDTTPSASNGEVPATVPEVPAPKKIEVGEDVLKAIHAKLEKQDAELVLLRKVADKSQLARHTSKETIGRAVRVATIEGKLVTSWKLLSNIATYRKGEEKVDQKGEFTLEDGSKVPYSIEEFRDLIEPVWVDVDLNKTTFEYDQDGNRRGMKEIAFTWKGQETTISSQFINP